jgi:hypothetical protein
MKQKRPISGITQIASLRKGYGSQWVAYWHGTAAMNTPCNRLLALRISWSLILRLSLRLQLPVRVNRQASRVNV